MGSCTSKTKTKTKTKTKLETKTETETTTNHHLKKNSPSSFPFYTPSPSHYPFNKKNNSPSRNKTKTPSSSSSTPSRFFKKPFPPPSPTKHIKSLLARRPRSVKVNKEVENEGLDKGFGFLKNIGGKYEVGEEVIGKGHFGYICKARIRKGELKNLEVAVKVIPKAKALLARKQESVKVNEEVENEGLDKGFGFLKNIGGKYEVGEEVIGRGHFGYTCKARIRKGELKNLEVAVKVITKAKMTTAIAIEDVRREVKMLKALTGHKNLVQFYDAFEDHENVYIVMELCEGGELLDRILSRGGKYPEEDAKAVLIQILDVISFCHLQGVVHRDLKPENFLFTSKDENSPLKAIDFGLSDFVRPDERLNDIVGSAYYVAPEVLHRSYSTEADIWSIGVIAYILLCGSRPFWSRTESGIFRAVLKADPSFDEAPWLSVTAEAKDFVKRLLNKDPRRRMSAAQALSHPWMKRSSKFNVPLDIQVFKLMKTYMHSSPLRKAALKALAKTLTVDELFYLREQFLLLEPNKNGTICLDNVKSALTKNATDAMKDSRVLEFLASLNALQYRRMDFEEFCVAGLSVHQLEGLDRWEQHVRCAYEFFEKDGNRAIIIEELASELGVGPSVPVYAVLQDWIRHTDGKLSFLGFVKLLHGVSS